MLEDCKEMPNNPTVTPASAELVDELLADLDIEPGAAPEVFSPADLAELGVASPVAGFAGAMQEWRQRDDEQREERAAARRKANAAEERRLYRDSVNPSPRDYHHHDHAPRQPHETEEDRQRRMKRDRARSYRGVTAEQIEANAAARQAVTSDERKRKKAEADAARRAAMTPEQRKAEAEKKKLKRAEKKKQEAAEAQVRIAEQAIF